MKQSWSIVVLCYNEAANLRRVVEAVEALLREIASEGEIVVVDDGSRDDSPATIRALAAEGRVIGVFHPRNLGIGEALRSGYARATKENVCAIPGDGQFDENELRPFAELPPRTFVSFTRRTNAEYSLYRKALTRVNRQVNRRLLGASIEDANWVKVYKLASLRALGELEVHSSLVQSEIAAKMLVRGEKMLEPDSKYLARKGGTPKGASVKIVLQAARETLSLARIVRRFRRSNASR